MKRFLVMGVLACVLIFGANGVYAQDENQEEYEDFSGGARFGTWALNAFAWPGVGSYAIMKDKVGGNIQMTLSFVAPALVGIGFLLTRGYFVGVEYPDEFDYRTYDRYGLWDGGIKDSYYEDLRKYEEAVKAQNDIGVAVIVVGGGLFVFNFVYNIVRSSTYHRPNPQLAALFDPSALNIALLPAKDGTIDRVQVLYTIHF